MIPREIPIAQLDLDPENPRLPESVPRDEENMLSYFVDHGTLEELAQSFLDNGYFEAERMLVLEEDDRFIVVEGNRRLATLKLLHGYGDGYGLAPPVPIDDESDLDQLRDVPCLVVPSRAAVRRYLAFRHIGGLKTWGAEAKARFLRSFVRDAVTDGEPRPFYTVGRQVGGNAQGVRNQYLALELLETARTGFGADITHVRQHRFGVWLRCMNSANLRTYIGVEDHATYEQVTVALTKVNGEHLKRVVRDLSPRSGGRLPVLADSRLVTIYGNILANARARKVLDEYGSIERARRVIDELSLPDRLMDVANQLDEISARVRELDAPPDDLLSAAKHAYRAATTVYSDAKTATELG